jgi:3-phosphoshikimate 1-carboxyvinyltransferase
MILRVSPSLISGQISVPSSKSLSQRFIAASLLAGEPTKIYGLSDCNDSTAALEIAANLGAEIELGSNAILITPSPNGIPSPRTTSLSAGESGLSFRMFSAFIALCNEQITFTGHGSLLSRDQTLISSGLLALGAQSTSNQGKPPLTITGPILGGEITIDGSNGSQFLTGLLLALPYADIDSTIHVKNLVSRPYVEMTLEVMSTFDLDFTHEENDDEDIYHIPGNQSALGGEFAIDGDWSAAASLLVLGALCGRPELEVTGIRGDFTQADSAIKGALLFAGYHLLGTDEGLSVKKKRPKPLNLDLTNSPDLFPALAALAVFSNKPSRFRGVHRLENKESSRAIVLQSEFKKAGIIIDIEGDTMIVHPGKPISCRINPNGDHRIAMAAAILGCAGCADVEILNAECVAKSYPTFFDDLASIGGIVEEVK